MASLLSFSLPKPSLIKASATTTTLPTPEILEERFGRKGIKFLECNNIPLFTLLETSSLLTLIGTFGFDFDAINLLLVGDQLQ